MYYFISLSYNSISLQKIMHLKPHPSLQIDFDQPLTRWDDSVLAPKHQNIQIDNFINLVNRPYNRKQIFATNRRTKYKNNKESD